MPTKHTAFEITGQRRGRLPDARKSDAPIWFSGYKQRAVTFQLNRLSAMIELKHYQQKAIDKVRQVLHPARSAFSFRWLLELEKPLLRLFIAKTAASKGNNTMFICNRRADDRPHCAGF